MKRWHAEVGKMRSRLNMSSGYKKNLGRFRKRHPCDCGRAKCGICNFDKKYDVPTHKDIRDRFDRDEQLKDYL